MVGVEPLSSSSLVEERSSKDEKQAENQPSLQEGAQASTEPGAGTGQLGPETERSITLLGVGSGDVKTYQRQRGAEQRREPRTRERPI